MELTTMLITAAITFFGLISGVFLFTTGAEPIQTIKHAFNLSNDDDYINPVQWFILKLVNCSMCTGFWVGLLFYKSIILACVVSIMAELLTRKMIN